jgi:tetratricopeptide (TPR) repeat protein
MERTLFFCGVLAAVITGQGCAERLSPTPSQSHDLSRAYAQAPSQSETLALLDSGNFRELEQRFAIIQTAYDKGAITDEDLRAAFRVFYSTNADLEVRYDGWVSLFPRSYVAHLARAIYYVRIGNAERGVQSVDQTAAKQLEAAETSFNKATAEIATSIALEPKPLLSFVNAILVARKRGDTSEARRWVDRANEVDPGNYIARAAYMTAIETRWGGSQQMMQEFLEQCRAAKLSNAHMQVLESVIAEDQGWIHQFVDHEYAAAEAAYRKSGELGGDRQLSNLADVLLKQNKYREALELLTEELAAKPGDLDVLANRSAAYMKIGMLREGLDDLRAAAQGGSAYAQCELGRYYMIGIPGVLTPDPAAGIEWFTKSAAQGYSAGQENLRRARQLFGDSPPH